MTTVYEFTATQNNGEEKTLSDYQGRVLLIVNTASKCGFTPQYEGLQALQDKYAERGFDVLGFPCDQFGHQEPGSDDDIRSFCDLNYQVKFPLYKKIEVNGSNAHPLYEYLKDGARGVLGSKNVKWNFTKFLINKEGKVVKRYAPATKPESIAQDIEQLLG